MKDLSKKWWFEVIVILILSVIICIYNSNNTTLNNYKKQSIAILNQYEKGETTRKEGGEKITALSDKMSNEYNINKESYILALESKISLIALKLNYGELSNTEIDKYIQEIREIKEIK